MAATTTAPLLPLPILQGERCLLRRIVPDDAPALLRHADDVDVSRNLFEGFPSPYLASHAQAWCGHEANSGEFGYVWAIVVDDALIGCAGLVPHSGAGNRCNAETGYWIGKAYWRRGIASDALAQIVDWGFAALPHLTRIYAPIYSRNEGSQAVARHCGFVREGVQKQAIIKNGEVIDLTIWASYRTQIARRDADIGAALAATAASAMERA
jgi:[ribosomal protein S5]-alanine N-acetyltransferase